MLRPVIQLCLFIGALLLGSACKAKQQDYLLLIVSPRNAETISDAAQWLKQQYPQLGIQARTERQISELKAAEPERVLSLFANARAVLAMGVYGPAVSDILTLLKATPQQTPLLIFNSDHRLVQQSRLRGELVFKDLTGLQTLSKMQPEGEFSSWLNSALKNYPQYADWIKARSYWQAGGSENTTALMIWVWQQLGADVVTKPAKPLARLRWFHLNVDGEVGISDQLPALNDKPLVVIMDHSGGGRSADSALLKILCQQIQQHDKQCLAALAYWGAAGVEAAKTMTQLNAEITSVIMLQDFVVGGGEGREAVTKHFQDANVPVIKAIKLRDRTADERLLSSDGLAHDKVYYQVAMPELQGASQPLVIATAGSVRLDDTSGIRIQPIAPLTEGIAAIISRITRWQTLQNKANKDKKIAIVYYNHPPGRHNIGADNLDVPASLWHILNQLKAAGYQTGELPASADALLDLMQEKAVNLPNDRQALQTLHSKIPTMNAQHYQHWFDELPQSVQKEMEFGPFGLLHEQIRIALKAGQQELAEHALEHTLEEMHHLLEGVDHPGRARALALVEQLESCYLQAISSGEDAQCMKDMPKTIAAIKQTGIEGLGGWGKPPGKVMTWEGKLLLPSLQFGNVFIGPQPPRGWEINEELLHANLAFPPPHQYLAFYYYLQNDFKADALIHLGRHSTYEFLPRRSVGLAEDDYSRIVAADIPGIYPYIVDGVGEGIQAKRRGLAVMVDHLTPPLKSTALYDELLQLRQLIESFEARHGGDNAVVAQRLVQQIRDKVDALELKDELAEAMSAELAVMGISFDEVDDDMMVHEVGHYLTDLQERFMPLGLHVYGKNWQAPAVEMMLNSMAPENAEQKSLWQQSLSASPRAEVEALLNGLDGKFISPGPGNDPIRSPESLPTGRNFYALDSSLVPSRVAWQLGKELASDARAKNPQNADKREALVLWASDVVRDEGVMIAFGLDMLGLEPEWNSRGLVKGIKHQSMNNGRVRRDTVFTTSGLFRDLYASQMMLLNKANLMALDASQNRIIKDYPALTLALSAALEPLGKEGQGGNEPLQKNQVAAHWVKQAQALMVEGIASEKAGTLASLRVFGDAPGAYGAGINRLTERSGAWQHRRELAEVYTRRLGHAYGAGGFGIPAQKVFKHVLADVDNTYFGRSSNLYGLIDNNDAFDYLGGLSLAVETASGHAPNNFVINHADPKRIKTQSLHLALRQELRGRFLNPEWLKALMPHGYAGARTMGSEFLEYLWGWQVTNPTLVGDWAWEEVKAVYMDDKYALGLDDFLEQNHNAHVKANMLAIMLVAVNKGFWQANDATVRDLAKQFVKLVNNNGLPGSGHTDPNHPMMPWLNQFLDSADQQALQAVLNAAKPLPEQTQSLHRLTEIQLDKGESNAQKNKAQRSEAVANTSSKNQTNNKSENTNDNNREQTHNLWLYGFAILFLAILFLGFVRGIWQITHQKHRYQTQRKL